jgi:hypothetical protein
MPRWAVALNFVIPTGADPDFLHRGAAQGDVCGFLRKPHKVRQRPQAGQEIRGSAGEGPAVSLGLHANADKRSTNPTRFLLKLTRLHLCSRHESPFLYKKEPLSQKAAYADLFRAACRKSGSLLGILTNFCEISETWDWHLTLFRSLPSRGCATAQSPRH